MVRMKWDCRLSTGLPPSSRLRRLWSWKEVLQWAWNRDRKAAWDQVGLSHCWHEGLVTVWDEARRRRGCNDDQSRRGHQCSETMLTGKSWFDIGTPLGIWTWVPCDGKQTGSPLDQWDMVRKKWDYRLSTGLPHSSRFRRLWSWKEVLHWAWNQDRKAAWDQVGLSHCWHEGLVTVWDKARRRRGGNDDQSRRGHQCSETSLTGESRFQISTPREFELGFLVTWSKQVVHWTSETWWEWSEIAGSPQYKEKAQMKMFQRYFVQCQHSLSYWPLKPKWKNLPQVTPARVK